MPSMLVKCENEKCSCKIQGYTHLIGKPSHVKRMRNVKEKNGLHWYECPKKHCPFKTNPSMSYSGAALAGNRHRRDHTDASRNVRNKNNEARLQTRIGKLAFDYVDDGRRIIDIKTGEIL